MYQGHLTSFASTLLSNQSWNLKFRKKLGFLWLWGGRFKAILAMFWWILERFDAILRYSTLFTLFPTLFYAILCYFTFFWHPWGCEGILRAYTIPSLKVDWDLGEFLEDLGPILAVWGVLVITV